MRRVPFFGLVNGCVLSGDSCAHAHTRATLIQKRRCIVREGSRTRFLARMHMRPLRGRLYLVEGLQPYRTDGATSFALVVEISLGSDLLGGEARAQRKHYHSPTFVKKSNCRDASLLQADANALDNNVA